MAELTALDVEISYIKDALSRIEAAITPLGEKINNLEKQNITVCASITEIRKDQNGLGDKVRELENAPAKKRKSMQAWLTIGATVFGGSFVYFIWKLFELLAKGVKP